MARLLADENLPRPVVIELRRLGHDVIGLDETEGSGRWSADEEVLGAATAAGRSVLTVDRGFTRLLPGGARHSGLVVCSFDLDFTSLAERIDGVISTLDHLDGQVICVGRRRPTSDHPLQHPQ
jgi:predicted nuclease of predicted toxin-antitoxin system